MAATWARIFSRGITFGWRFCALSMKKKRHRRKMTLGVIVLIAATVSAAALAVMLRAQRLHGQI
jgi:hypothetical protein